MNKFCKLFDLKEAQVLVVKEMNQNEEEFEISLTTEVEGVRIKQIATYESENKRDAVFEQYEENQANSFFLYMKNQLTGDAS